MVAGGQPDLHRVELGAGMPLLVLHGGPDLDSSYLRPELDVLAEVARLVYVDQRGRGRSYRGGMPEQTGLAVELADIDATRRALGVERLVLLGHSFGGLLTLEYALRHPEAVAGVVLLNTAPVSFRGRELLSEALRQARTPEELRDLERIVASEAYRSGDLDADLAYYRIHYRPALRSQEHLEAVLPRLRAHFSPESVVVARQIEDELYAQTWWQPDYDLLAELPGLRPPLLVVHGSHDFVPLRIAEEIAAAARAARLIVVPESGHFSYLDDPDLLVDVVREFLATL